MVHNDLRCLSYKQATVNISNNICHIIINCYWRLRLIPNAVNQWLYVRTCRFFHMTQENFNKPRICLILQKPCHKLHNAHWGLNKKKRSESKQVPLSTADFSSVTAPPSPAPNPRTALTEHIHSSLCYFYQAYILGSPLPHMSSSSAEKDNITPEHSTSHKWWWN